MDGENNEGATPEKTKIDSVIEFSDGHRPPLIRIEDGKVNVSTLKVSMSRKHRIIMYIDLWTIAWASALTVYMARLGALAQYRWYILAFGAVLVVCAIGKTIADFSNWLYTMNVMLEQMGSWYLDDIVGICQDFMAAGSKIAAEEKQSAQMSKTGTEEDDAVLEDYTN